MEKQNVCTTMGPFSAIVGKDILEMEKITAQVSYNHDH